MARDGTELQTEHAATTQALLQTWLSPSFPVGAYAYSHGLEAAAADGRLADAADLEAWLRVLLVHGSIRNDLILLAAAWRGYADALQLVDLNDLAIALQPSAERHLETTQQGTSFAAAIAAAWPCDAIEVLRRACPDAIAYPIAVGVAARGHAIALDATLSAFAQAFVQTLVSAAIRLSVVGQTDAQRTIAALLAEVVQAADGAALASLDDLGGAAFGADLAALEHETLYSRLFRS